MPKNVSTPEFYKLVKDVPNTEMVVKDTPNTEMIKPSDTYEDIFENKYKRQTKVIYKNIIKVFNSNISDSRKVDIVNRLLQNFNINFLTPFIISR